VGTIVETNTDDSPFLVDSVSEELAARELRVRLLVHPVVGTVRDERGRIERVLSGRDASHRESVMHYELERRLGEAERTDLERKIGEFVHHGPLVAGVFDPMEEGTRHMMDRAGAAAGRYSPEEVSGTVDFLDWL